MVIWDIQYRIYEELHTSCTYMVSCINIFYAVLQTNRNEVMSGEMTNSGLMPWGELLLTCDMGSDIFLEDKGGTYQKS